MARTQKIDRRFADAVRELEEEMPVGRLTVPKDRRGKSSTAHFRAGRGGRKAKTKVLRAKVPGRTVSCYVSRR